MDSQRVLLADDHQLVRNGFRALLERLGATVVGEATDGHQAIQMAQSLEPDVVLMDIQMPILNGVEAAARIVKDCPRVKVIILSMHGTPEYARRAIAAGAAGYLLKNASAAELEIALKAVARNETYLSPGISKYVMSGLSGIISTPDARFEKLSSRQREILQLIAEGYSRREVAEKLNISVKTFDSYRAQLMEYLDIRDVPGLVRFATKMGLVAAE